MHLLSWNKERTAHGEALTDPDSRQAWGGTEEAERGSGSPRLFQTVFNNPLPGETIASLEWMSLFSRATPWLMGVTLERGGNQVSHRPEPAPRHVQKSFELSDAAYHDQLLLRVRDEASGAALTNATAALTISDEEGGIYFGEGRADGKGEIRLAFPPQQTVGYDVLVRAPGHRPAVIANTWTNGTELARSHEVALARGIQVGGVVRRSDGAPIKDATITLFQVTSIGAHQYQRIDFDQVRSGADGRWTTATLPERLTNFSLWAAHPDFRGALYRVGEPGGAPEARLLSSEELRRGGAAVTLLPPIHVTGTIADEAGKGVPGAEVTLTEPGRAEPGGMAVSAKTDKEGRFSVATSMEGEAALLVRASGYALKAIPLTLEGEAPPLSFRLDKARPFRGRVVDQNQEPVVGARVRYEPENGNRRLTWQTMTDGQGRFVWDSPPSSEFTFYVTATNYSSTRMSFAGYGDEQMIRLRKQSRVIGRVTDAETGKPLEEFQVLRGHRYNDGEPMRWARYDTVRGRRGEFSMRLEEYSQGASQVLVEAPGYIPEASSIFETLGVFTNNFALKKGHGISGTVYRSDGVAAAGVSLALVDSGESVEVDRSGELRRSSSGPSFQRSNANGHFEFPPKYDPNTILATSADGFAQVSASNVAATGKIILEPWGRVEGVVKLRGNERGQGVVLRSSSARYSEPGRVYSALDLGLTTEPDAHGAFVFDKAPPGLRQVALVYRIGDRDNGRTGYSHDVPVAVRSRATTNVVIGGHGRRVIGRVIPQGADPEELDWRRDINQMSTSLTVPASYATYESRPNMTPAERQAAMREYNRKEAAFWRTPEGQRLEQSRRSYVLLFETNGTFRIDDVAPGDYSLYVRLTNPERPLNYYETIGSQSFNFTIPAAPDGDSQAPHNVGDLKLSVRNFSRPGRRAPLFEAKTFDGKTIRLEEMKGKHVLLDFWATWAGERTADIRVLKEVQNTYGKDGRCVLVGLNLDQDQATATNWVTRNGLGWTQCYLGAWGASDVPGQFGIQGLPEVVLVDPEGRIAAKGLRGPGIRNAVRNALGRTSTP
jgi:hypothetical protein